MYLVQSLLFAMQSSPSALSVPDNHTAEYRRKMHVHFSGSSKHAKRGVHATSESQAKQLEFGVSQVCSISAVLLTFDTSKEEAFTLKM